MSVATGTVRDMTAVVPGDSATLPATVAADA
jgi:hypothetical protein